MPACKDCNTGKRQNSPTTSFEETLHPYFDDLNKGVWLKSEVVKSNPISIQFYIEKQSDWDDLLYKRVQHHFEEYGLAQLYAVQAARELGSIKNKLQKHVTTNKNLKRFLQWEAESHRSDLKQNSWQAALYSGLAEDKWFCSVGFKQND